MFQDFSWRHLPALYFGFANCIGIVMNPLKGSTSTMSMYGFQPNITDVPETGPVWEAGQGRTILLGLLMHAFYWRGQYAACDTMLMGAAWLGVHDFLVFWDQRDMAWAWFRLVGSVAFAATGYFGWTEGLIGAVKHGKTA